MRAVRFAYLLPITAVAALAPASATAPAATTIGSTLVSTPAFAFNCNPANFCSVYQAVLPALNTAAGGLTSPINGVVVRWRISVSGPGKPATPRVFHPVGGGQLQGAGTGTAVIPNTDAISTFDTRLPIQAGDSFGLDCCETSALMLFLAPTATSLRAFADPTVPDGSSAAFTASGVYEYLFNADVEPDADHDGYGDETQDNCPTDASTQGACPTATPPKDTTLPPKDTTPPTLSTVSKTSKLSKRGTISFELTSNETATGAATGTVSLPKTAKTIRFKPSQVSLAAQKPTKITLKLSKKNAAVVRKALKKRALKAKVAVTVKDAAGNPATKKQTLKLKR